MSDSVVVDADFVAECRHFDGYRRICFVGVVADEVAVGDDRRRRFRLNVVDSGAADAVDVWISAGIDERRGGSPSWRSQVERGIADAHAVAEQSVEAALPEMGA